MKLQNCISGFCLLSALSLGVIEQSQAQTITPLSTSNTLYSFGNQVFGNNPGQCRNNVLTCNGTFNSSASFTGVTFNPFSAQGVGAQGTDFGFEQGSSPSTEPDSLGLAVLGPLAGGGGSANGFTNSATRVVTKYFSFSATIAPLYELSISASNFSIRSSGSRVDFSSIVGGSETFLALNQATNGTYQGAVPIPLTSTTYSNASGFSPLNVEFRVYVYSVGNAAGFGIDTVSFNGSITQVPFDFAPNFGIAVLGGLYVGRKVIKKVKSNQENDTSKKS